MSDFELRRRREHLRILRDPATKTISVECFRGDVRVDSYIIEPIAVANLCADAALILTHYVD